MTGRFAAKSSDARGLGRWTTLSITGRNKKMIHIICLYRVSQEQSQGDQTSYMQQIRLLKQQGVVNPNPRQQVFDDLETILHKWKGDNNEVILMMDTNSDLHDGALTNIIHKHKLCDALGSLHGHDQPPTYARGKRTIDYIFCSEQIIDSIVKGGILSYNEIIPSDHRALFIDININQALKGTINGINRQTTTFFTTKHKKKCKKYRELVTSEIQQYDMIGRIQAIVELYKKGFFDNEEYQEWDKTMTMIMTEAAKKCEVESKIWWSPELHFAHLGVKYWNIKITQKQINIDMSRQLKAIKNELPEEYDLTYGKQDKSIFGYLRAAKKKLHQCKKASKSLRKEHQKLRIIESIETNNKKLNKRIKAIMYAEEASKMYAILKHYLHPQDRKALTFIDIHKKDNTFDKRVVI